MGIIKPSPSFYFCDSTNNYPSTPNNSVVGISYTVGLSHADGASATLLSALSFDAHYLILGLHSGNDGGDPNNLLADILIDPAGGTSWTNFIDDLVCGYNLTPTLDSRTSFNHWFHFPIYIKSGSSLGIRARSSGTGAMTGYAVAYVYGNPNRPEMWWCGSKVESLGINAGSSSGTDVTAGASGAWGSWTDIGTSTSNYGAVQFSVNGTSGTDGTTLAKSFFWEIGYSSTTMPGSPRLYREYTTAESGRADWGQYSPLWCDVPSGTVWQLRAMCGQASPETQNGAIYGVY